jgi:NOL1/NOP2/fmu family ribosome biogenesis protein
MGHASLAKMGILVLVVFGSMGLFFFSGCGLDDDVYYTLTVKTSGDGETSIESEEYLAGENVSVIATADDGWEFSKWTGDASGNSSHLLITMDSDKTITAVFTQTDFTLNVSVQGSGDVDPSYDTYTSGETVTVTATADDDWVFAGWSGTVSSMSNPLVFDIDSDTNLMAVFVSPEDEYTYTLTRTGEGSVSPSSGKYTYGSMIELTATADDGWHFLRWSGDESGFDTTIYHYVTGNVAITATFEKDDDEYTLTPSVSGSGTVDPDEADEYDADEEVTLTADPGDDCHFVRWSGDITGLDKSITITMDSTKNVTAVFEADADEYDLTATVIGQGSVSPTFGTYDEDESISVTATASDSWTFVRWEGDVTETQSTTATITIEMSCTRNITAVFEPES